MRVLKDKPESSCMVVAANDYTQITAGPNSITTTRERGNFINGPLSISSAVDSIRVGGIYKFNPLLSTGIPSTMMTPIPTLVMDVPMQNISSLGKITEALKGVL